MQCHRRTLWGTLALDSEESEEASWELETLGVCAQGELNLQLTLP